MTQDTLDHPTLGIEEARRLVAGETSFASRAIYTLLLATSLCVTAAIASLLVTEQGLPLRTRVAFAVLVGAGLAWSAFFAWNLSRRKVLYAYHRVVAGRLAVIVTALFAVGSLALAALEPELARVGLAAGTFGTALVVVALWVLARARSRRRDLLALRNELEARVAD